MHLKRWLTSLFLIPVLVALLFLGGRHLLPLFVVLVCVLSLREYYRIVCPQGNGQLFHNISLWGYAMGPILILCVHFLPLAWLLFFFPISLVLPAWGCMRRFEADAGIPSMLAHHAMAMIYIPLTLAGYVLIYHTALGPRWIFLILCVVSVGDAGAYYVGSLWGRRKLCPSVSPGKTVEGALGGLAANLVVGLSLGNLLLPSFSLGKGTVFFLVLGVAGQVGDLFESMLKRSAGVKDSGHLLPGHGGLLDRIDSLLFVSPVALVMALYVF